MSSMTMNMSVPHISASEPSAESAHAAELAAALRAGWQRADLDWEWQQELGNARIDFGDTAGAAKHFRRAGWIAFWHFGRADPRRATTLANLALIDRISGRESRARRRYGKAISVWPGVHRFVAEMQIARRARSSLFHLRMEAKHWDTYQENMRIRMTAFARESADALAALERGELPVCRLYGRWKAEKPPVYDDTRKMLAAALLIAVWGKR